MLATDDEGELDSGCRTQDKIELNRKLSLFFRCIATADERLGADDACTGNIVAAAAAVSSPIEMGLTGVIGFSIDSVVDRDAVRCKRRLMRLRVVFPDVASSLSRVSYSTSDPYNDRLLVR